MDRRRRIIHLQWAQLITLAIVHFFLDMFVGMVPALLPRIQADFGLSVALGGIFLSVLHISCNVFQIATGHLRSDKRTPFFLPLGLFLSSSMVLIAVLPRSESSFWVMIVIAAVVGFGVAVIHPESLRGVHALKRLHPAMSTAVFLGGGIFGYAAGGWVGTQLVETFGFIGLFFMLALPVTGLAMTRLLRIRLAVEQPKLADSSAPVSQGSIPFGLVMFMASSSAVSTVVLTWLIPQRIAELGFELTFGGLSNMLVGFGSAIGGFFWAHLAHKKGEPLMSVLALVLGLPLLLVYLLCIHHRLAAIALFVVGFSSLAAYPLIVTMARRARGLNIGQRMAWSVGGAWGVGSLFPIVLGPVAKNAGVQTVLNLTPIGYILAAVVGLWILYRYRRVTT